MKMKYVMPKRRGKRENKGKNDVVSLPLLAYNLWIHTAYPWGILQDM